MADNVKGITIQIGGDVQPFNAALQEASKSAQEYSRKLDDINKKLKLDPKNVELLTKKQDILSDAIVNSREKVEGFQKALEEATQKKGAGDITEAEFQQIQKATSNAEAELQDLESQLSDTTRQLEMIKTPTGDAAEELDDLGESAEDAEGELGEMNSSMVTLGNDGFKTLEGEGYGLLEGFAKIASGAHGITDAIFKLDAVNLGGLIGTFAGVAIKINDVITANDALIQHTQLLNKEIDESKAKWAETQRATEKQTDTYLVLFRKVNDLNEKVKIYKQRGDDITGVTRELEYWTGILNDTVGDAVVTYDKETGMLKENNKELTQRYQNLRNNAILEAQANRLKDLYVQQYEAEQEVLHYQELIESGAVHMGTSYQYLQNEAQKRLDSVTAEIGVLEKANSELIQDTAEISDTYYTEGKDAGNQYYHGWQESKAASKIKSDIKDAIYTQIYASYGSGKKFIGGIQAKLAQGGIVTRPTRALVGEAGPEAIIPLDKLGDIIRGALSDNRSPGGTYSLNVYPRDMSSAQQDQLLNKFNNMLGSMTSRRNI